MSPRSRALIGRPPARKDSSMKKIIALFSGLILLAGFVSASLISCSPAPTAPAAPTPTPTINYSGLSAFATIGSSSNFTNPAGMIFSGGNIWITDQGNGTFQEWTTAGAAVTSITTFNTSDTFYASWGVNADPITGNIYVADANNGRLVVFNSSGNYLTEITAGGSDVRGIAINCAGVTAFVTDFSGGGYIYHIGGTPTVPTFTLTGHFGQSGSGTLVNAYQCSLDAVGNVWVADYFGTKVEEYTAGGAHIKTLTSTSFSIPTDVKVLADGTILVTDEGAGKVFVFNAAGAKIGTFGAGILSYPEDIEIAGGKYYVSDWYNSQIVVFH